MTSISRPACLSVAAPAPLNGAAPGSDAHPALIGLVRLLARQAVREWLSESETTEDEDADARSSGSRIDRP